MINYISKSQPIIEITDGETVNGIIKQLQDVADKLMIAMWEAFTDWKSINLLNNAITFFSNEVTRKTGTLPKPSHTGSRSTQ